MGNKSKLIVSMTATAGHSNPNNAQGFVRAVVDTRSIKLGSVFLLGLTGLSAADDAAQAEKCAAYFFK